LGGLDTEAAAAGSRSRVINNRFLYIAYCVAFVFYSFYVYTAGTEAAHVPQMSDNARRGQELFQEHNCIACHQFYGLGGYMGPDLTNTISNRGAAYAGVFIANGTTRMPNLGINEADTASLVAYLEFVDSTGTYPPKDYEVTWYGTVRQEDDPR
jgi:nitric oxide reductase subunit C